MSSTTFFAKNQKTGELKIGDRNRRNILIALIENNELVSIPQLSNKSQVSQTDTREIIENFVKSNVVSPLKVGDYKSRKDYKYELTKIGIMYALVIKFDENLPLGEKKKDLLVKALQPDRGIDTINQFQATVLINAVNLNLDDYVLRFLRKILEIVETSSDPNLWKVAENIYGEAKPSEIDTIGKAVLQSLGSLEPTDRDIIFQFYRNMTINKLFEISMRSHNIHLQALARESQRDLEGVFLPFECKKCGYQNERLYITMEEIIIKTFTGGWRCPKCGKLVTETDIQRKGFRNQRLNVPAK